MTNKPSRSEFKRIHGSLATLIRIYGVFYMLYILMPDKFIAKIEGLFFAWMYSVGIYKATLVNDGMTDNRRAMQARLDVDGGF